MTMTSTSAKSAQPKIELLPPSVILRIGRRRLTLSWRARKPLPSLLSSLLRRSWRRVLAPVLKVSVVTAAVCGAWQTQALAAAPAPGTLPSGWSVVNGNVTFTQNGNTLNISQLTPQAIAEFASFSIGSGAVVDISQPGAAAAFLAKVTGGDISQIYGKLTAPGTVVLFNPNGVMVGAGGVVDVGRFVATTLNISNDDFLAGKLTFAKDRATVGSVENYGNITSATGGSVYLIGSSVTNGGIIKSPQGEVILAAGQTVTLADTATPGVTVNVTGGAGDVTNLGSITAEAGRIGIAAGLITNSGNISASSVVREGGRIFLRASGNLTTTASSNISADGTTGGNITLFADNKAYIDGDVSAIGTAGVGGFVDTSGHQLDVIKAPTVGAGGTWLIDPYDLVVGSSGALPVNGIIESDGSASTIAASVVSGLLNAGTSVILQTGSVGGAQAGNITVNSDITKIGGSSSTLLLNAYNNITINANITDNSSCGTLSVTLHSNYLSPTTGLSHAVSLNNAGINLKGGALTLLEGASSGAGDLNIIGSAGQVVLGSGGSLSARNVVVGTGSQLLLDGVSSVNISGTLNNSGTTNISGASSAQVQTLTNGGDLNLGSGTVEFVSMVSNAGNMSLGDGANVLLDGGMTNTGTLRNDFSAGSATINASAAVTNTNSGRLNFTGGSCSTVTLTGSGLWSSAGNLNVTTTVNVRNALSNTGTITLGNSAILNLQGGMNNSGLFQTQGSSSQVQITAGDDVTNNVNGTMLFGGTCATTSVSGSGTWTNLGNITVNGSGHQLSFGAKMLVNNATLNVTSGGHQITNLANNGNVNLRNSSSLQVNGGTMNGSVNVEGGSGLTLNGSNLTSRFAASGSGDMYWTGNITLTGAVTLAGDGPTLTFNDGDTTAYIAAADGNAANSLTTRNQVKLKNSAIVGLDVNTVWNNYGTITQGADETSTTLDLSSGARINNQAGGTLELGSSVVSGSGGAIFNAAGGTINIAGGRVNYMQEGPAQPGVSIDNNGLFNASEGSRLYANGSSDVLYNNVSGVFNVSGAVSAYGVTNNGTINVGQGANLQGSSTFVNDSTGTLALDGGTIGAARITNYGTVKGNGTISVSESGFHNSGTVAPGTDGTVGRLTVTGGSFVQESDGTLLIDIAGADSYDTIVAQNGITLGGTLKTSLLGSYTGATVAGVSDNFSIFGADTYANGYFRNVQGTIYNTAAGKAMVKARYNQTDANQSGNALVLSLGTGEDFTSTGSGDWGSLSTWNLGYLPTAVDRVTIAGGSNVSNSGTDIIDKLTMVFNSTLGLGSGANLSVNSGSQIGGIINVNATSSIAFNSGANVTGAFNVNGGNLTLAGLTTGNGTININNGVVNTEGGSFLTNVEVVGNTQAPNVTIANAQSNLRINMNGGNLTLSGDALIDDLAQTGGNITSATRLVAAHTFRQTGGNMTLADASLTQDNGAMTLGNITANNLLLYAGDGNITQNSGSALHVTRQLIASARSGIGLGNSGNQIAAFAANNTGAGDIVLTNSLNRADATQVTLNGVSAANGNVSVDNTGAMVTAAIGSAAGFANGMSLSTSTQQALQGIDGAGKVTASAGSVSLTTHSPLTVGAGGISASGGISLTAGQVGDPSSVLTTNGVLSAGGAVTLVGNSIAVNANILAGSMPPPSPTPVYASGVTLTVNGVTTTPNAASSGTSSILAQQASQQQNQQTQNLQSTINSAVVSDTGSSSGGVIQQSSNNQTTGGTSGTFGDEGENRQAVKKALPMCT